MFNKEELKGMRVENTRIIHYIDAICLRHTRLYATHNKSWSFLRACYYEALLQIPRGYCEVSKTV